MRAGLIAAVVVVIGVALYAATLLVGEPTTPAAPKTEAAAPKTEPAAPKTEPAARKTEPAARKTEPAARKTEPPAKLPVAATVVQLDDDNPPNTAPPPPPPADAPYTDPRKDPALLAKYGDDLALAVLLGEKLGHAPPEGVYALLDLKKTGATHDALIAFAKTKLGGDLKTKLWTTVWLEGQSGKVRTGNSGR